MKPKKILVFTLHDPTARITPLLLNRYSLLTPVFSQIYISLSPQYQKAYPDFITQLQALPNTTLVLNSPGSGSGENHFQSYIKALADYPSRAIFHLTDADRLAFILHRYSQPYLKSVNSRIASPLLFIRSPFAWSTHPPHYHSIENLATALGQIIFGKSVDFCWCYLVLNASDLRLALPPAPGPAQNIYAQLLLPLIPRLHSRPVDWLAWEDPFILGQSPRRYLKLRSHHPEDIQKRLSYVLPMLHLIAQHQTSILPKS